MMILVACRSYRIGGVVVLYMNTDPLGPRIIERYREVRSPPGFD